MTAGPTYEPIDPVRFIGNRSSGKMGIAIAHELVERGAHVVLILGPSSQPISNHERLRLIRVETSDEMYDAVMNEIEDMDIGVFSAAVADYKPKYMATEKIKKSDHEMSLELVKTRDILQAVGEKKKKGQYLVGFALETENEIANAKSKIQKKNLDIIVLNSLKQEGAGFQHDTNQITIIDRENKMIPFELKDKKEVARDIVDVINQNI